MQSGRRIDFSSSSSAFLKKRRLKCKIFNTDNFKV